MKLIKIENGVVSLSEAVGARLARFERRVKEIKEQEEKLKTELLEAMQEHNILKIDNDDISITRVLATDREVFDSKALRADNPDLYDKYIRFTPVKESLRLKVK